MNRSLDEHLEDVLNHSDEQGISTHTWFLLAVVAVRALIMIAKSAEKLASKPIWYWCT